MLYIQAYIQARLDRIHEQEEELKPIMKALETQLKRAGLMTSPRH